MRTSSELYADLVSNAIHEDGNAIARAIRRISGKRHRERENPNGAMVPNGIKITKLSDQDFHHTLRDARRLIWERYLEGKSDAESQKVFAALRQTERDWLQQAYPLFAPREPDQKFREDPPERELWQVDITALNRLFFKVFKSRLNLVRKSG